MGSILASALQGGAQMSFDFLFRGEKCFKSKVGQHAPMNPAVVVYGPQRRADPSHPLTALWIWARDLSSCRADVLICDHLVDG